MTNVLYVFAVLGIAFLAWLAVAVVVAVIYHLAANRRGMTVATYDGERFTLRRYDPKEES